MTGLVSKMTELDLNITVKVCNISELVSNMTGYDLIVLEYQWILACSGFFQKTSKLFPLLTQDVYTSNQLKFKVSEF